MPSDALGRAYIRLTGTNPNIPWHKLRKMVYERDGAICQVCHRPALWGQNYECGHIVDRVCGGPDEMENLVVMCGACNTHKPMHDTREQYELWVANGGWTTTFIEWMKSEKPVRYAEMLALSQEITKQESQDE